MNNTISIQTKHRFWQLILGIAIILYQVDTYAKEAVIIPDVGLTLKNNKHQQSITNIANTQFSSKDIQKSPVANLSQFLNQNQSAVRLTNTSGDASQTSLSLRGFGDNASANSLIMVDGFPLTNPSLLAPNFNSIPLTDIERIDIFQGSEGSLWGDQAVGGVMNIITKHPKIFFADTIIGAGSYNSYYANTLIGNKIQNGLFYKVFGLASKAGNYRNHNQQSGDNAAAQIGYDYARGTISLNLQSYEDTTYFPGGLTQEQFINNPRQATEFNNYSHYRTNLVQLLSKQELNSEWLLETRIDHHTTMGDGLVFVDYDRYDSSTSVSPRLIGKVYHSKLIVGYLGQKTQYELSNIKVQAQTSAIENDIYFQSTSPISSFVDLTIGARQAWQTNDITPSNRPFIKASNQVFVTEQGITIHPSKMLSFFVRRDGNFSLPKANEQTWIPANQSSLQVQTGASYEAGTSWLTDASKSQLSVYRLYLNNEIAFNPDQTPDQPFGAFNNFDKTLRDGMSLSTQYQIASQARVNSQLNYVNARFAAGTFTHNKIPAVPALTGNAGLTYTWTEKWTTQYNLLYAGSRYASNDIGNSGAQLPGYFSHDIALQYIMPTYMVSFEVHNLLNTQYVSYAYYNAASQQISYYPAAGRNYLVTLKINLN